MKVKVCVAGVTGWTGALIAKKILESEEFELTGAIARRKAGSDIGETLGLARTGINISPSLDQALESPFDVLIDYTRSDGLKNRVMSALSRGVRVVIGTSGLTADDFVEIEDAAKKRKVGVIASGNFSITAALATHFSLIAAHYLPSCEILDFAHAEKVDAPSGTARELAERLGEVRKNMLALPIDQIRGPKEARGANLGGASVHSIRIPSYVLSFETLFGLPNERLTIRHDAGTGAEPYVAGTLIAAKRVMNINGLIRGLDRLLFND